MPGMIGPMRAAADLLCLAPSSSELEHTPLRAISNARDLALLSPSPAAVASRPQVADSGQAGSAMKAQPHTCGYLPYRRRFCSRIDSTPSPQFPPQLTMHYDDSPPPAMRLFFFGKV